jgi:acyl-CoA synthetase (AMP-forming)/AMP-acid ligase II
VTSTAVEPSAARPDEGDRPVVDDATSADGDSLGGGFNIATVNRAIARAIPDRLALVHGDRRITYGALSAEAERFAGALRSRGIGAVGTERADLGGHESGQDHVALYLHNGVEYVTGMLGSFMARAVPVNVNYRYVAEELRYLLGDAGARVVVFHDTFASTLAAVLDDLPDVEVLVQVADGTGADLLPGAVRYEDFLAEGDGVEPDDSCSPDDLYALYTGGTTGMPKGVLWRQHDAFVSAMGGRPYGQKEPFGSVEEIVDAAERTGGMAMMTAAPLMHGAAQWFVFTAFTGGNTAVIATDPTRLDAADVLATAIAERAVTIQVVGDAMARPLVDELERGDWDASGLFMLANGGAALSTGIKDRFLEAVPNGMVLDAVGSSETGSQMGHTSLRGATSTGSFDAGPETTIVDETLTRELDVDDDGIGWLAQRGHVPLGYLGDAAKTAATFPVIDGTRFAVPGDRARRRADGLVELLGRDSMTVNSGGEKIFVEEVEQAIVHHPAVYDVIVVGRPSERWGNEVVAVVQLGDGVTADAASILEEAGRHIARYKLPKQVLFRDSLVRSPAGKADYRWAAAQAAAAAEG